MSAQQCTRLSARRNLAALRHRPAEAVRPSILGMDDREMQPKNSMQEQPAKEQREGELGAAAAEDLQPEMPPSTSQDRPTEVEGADVLGAAAAPDLQPEMPPQTSRDRLAEAAAMLCTTTAQGLQPEMQSSARMQHASLERTHHEDRIQIGFQPNMARGPEQPTQLLPWQVFMIDFPVLSEEPLKNELEKLKHIFFLRRKVHEQKKSKLRTDRDQEIEKIQRKYVSLCEKVDFTYQQQKMKLDYMRSKICACQSLAENFQGLLTVPSAAQGRSMSSVMAQLLQPSSAAQSTAPSVPTNQPPSALTSLHSAGSDEPSLVARPSSWAVHPRSTLPGNLYTANPLPSYNASATWQ